MAEKTLFKKLGNYLFGDDGAAPPPPAPRAASPRPGLPARLPAGAMQLIGLAGIQAALGDSWPARSEKIYRLVEGILKKRLDVTDAYYKVDTENFLILFTRLGHREAEFKAKVISDEIQKLILGEVPEGHDVIVSSSVTEVERSLVLDKVGSLKDLLDYVRSATPPAEYGNITFFDSDPDGSAASQNAAVVGAGPDMADLDQSLTGLFQEKTIASFLKECRAGFYPAFSLKRQSFSSYQTAAIHVPTGKPALQVQDPFLSNPEELAFHLDRYILTTGLLGVHRMLTAGKQGIVVMSVTYDTLATSKLREVYFARLKEIPGGIVKFLGVSVRNIPPGTPASRIAEIMAFVQPFCATRLLRIPADPKLIDLYADTGCHGFATWIASDETDPAHRFSALSNFTKRAALHRLECIMTDADAHDDVNTAVAAGFTYISGDAVAGMIETPGFTAGLSANHILQNTRSTP